MNAYIRKGDFCMNLDRQDLKDQIVTCYVENAHMDIGKRNKSSFEKL